MDEICDGLRDVVAFLPATILIMRSTSTCFSRATSGKAVLRNALHVRRRVPLGLAYAARQAQSVRENKEEVTSGECRVEGVGKLQTAAHISPW